VTYSTIDNIASSSATFYGCVSTFGSDGSGGTSVPARDGDELNSTYVSGPISMWAQPISVAQRAQDLSLFTTSAAITTSSTTSSLSSATARSSGSTVASQTAPPSSSQTSAAPSAGASQPASASGSGISTGAIAGIAIGGVLLLALVAGSVLFLRRRKRKSSQPPPSAPVYQDPNEGREKDAPQVQYQQYGHAELPGVPTDPNELPATESWKRNTSRSTRAELEG
jgi:Tfp pilus assembly protein FimV